MSNNSKTVGFYAFLFLLSIFLFMTVRWLNYRTPQVDKVVYEEEIKRGDPLISRFKNKPKDGVFYFKTITITKTVKAGRFPFLEDAAYDTLVEPWSRPIYNTYK